MNMKTFLTLFLLFALLPIKAQYDFAAIEKDRMARAKVKTQTQWTHDYVGGKPVAKGYRSAITTFDTRGNVIEIINYNKDGKVVLTEKTQYDRFGKIINFERHDDKKLLYSQRTTYDNSGRIVREAGSDGFANYSNTFTYDGSGRVAEISYTTNNSLQERRVFKYSGNKTEISVFNAANTLILTLENTYNDKGALLSELRRESQGNVVQSLNFQYNNFGYVLQEEKKRAGDKLDYQKIFFYDQHNRPIKEETTNPDGSKFVSAEYQYNNQGDMIFKSWRRNARATEPSTTRYTYDTRRLCVEEDSYFASSKFNSLYKYTYDFH